LSRYEDVPDFIYRVVTQDETRVQYFDPESKQNRACSGSTLAHPPKKFKRVPSAGKMMAVIFWGKSGDNHD
jgi:hypothetical protein